MEIGPELCFWNESSRSHQNGAQTSAQSFVGPSIYAQNPPSFRVPHLAGVVLELESESDNDSDNEVKWRDSTIEFRRSDIEETVKKAPAQLGVQEPTKSQPNIATTTTQVDIFHRNVDVEDSAGADTLVTQETTVSNVSEVMDVSKAANQSTTEARVQDQPVNSDKENNVDSGSLDKPTVESDEGPGRINQTSLSLTVPLTVGSIPTSPEMSHRSRGSNFQSKVTALPIGESETPRINRLSNGVQCVICARNFVDRRSRNIHMTKAHLGKTALSSGMSTGLKWLSCAATLPENHSAVAATTANNNCRNVNPLPCLQTSEEQDATIIEGYSLPALDTQDTTRPPSRSAAENDLGSNESTGSHNHHSPSSLSHSAIPTSPQSVVSNSSSHTKTRLSYAVSPSLNTPDAGCLKLRLVSVGNTGSKKSDQWDRSPQMDHARTPGFADSCSTDNTEPLGELEEGTKEDSPPRKIVRRTRGTTGKPSPERYNFQESPLHQQAVSRSTPEKSRTSVPRTRYSEMDQGSQVKSLRSCVIASRQQSSSSSSPSLPLSSSSSQHQQRSASLKELSKLQARRPTMDTSLRTPEGLYKCRICKRLFPNRFSLTGHYKSHYNSSQKPYNCDDCGQRYTSPSNLHYHRARNCPILKLRDVKNGKVTPKSDRSFKLIQTKAIKAAERQALSRTHETRTEGMTAYDTLATEVHTSAVCRRSNATCQSVKRDQPLCPRQRLLLESPDSHEGANSNNLCNAIPPPMQQVVGSDPPRIPCIAPLRTDSSVPSAFKSNIPKTPFEPPPTSTQALEESPQSNNSLSYLHEQLRHLLEQACQSDEARQKILAFTSLALLSALGPLSKPEQAEASSLPNSVFEALFSRFPGLLNSPECGTHVSARDAAHKEDLRQREPPSTSAKSPLCTNRTNVAQSPIEHRPVEKPSPGYMCQHCRNPQVFSDLTSFEAHLFLVHSNRSSRTPNSSSGHSSSPITSSTTFQANSQGPPVGSNASNHEQPTRPTSNTLGASPTSFFLKCSECDQPFSSFTDCQLHFTKMHQSYGLQRI
ncbi:hypothetical protein T265_05938 [Opisthorchis viverrini]|uniref:C2H2-type domain-containing protein n=1 Tax=Opisthorchis viverrini TaxID=6198 RepID=A0A074ZU07_OPIVI|nr:hypothetical protein T265_05938 [Opisthorchis viverrini]KER26880.1 hypothetical protein T265_05938 [Opisthorchis viverrini]